MKKTALLVCICIISTTLLNSIPVFAVENEEQPSEAMSEELLHDYLSRALDDDTTYSSGITSYDDFMTAYYDNLTYNYGINYKNSCGYIALGMFLSYYDTYLYDGIIPEQYDAVSVGTEDDMISRRNSPGIVRDVIQNVNNPDDDELLYMTANDYYSMLVSMSNYSLHAKLITIGAYYGNYNFSSMRAPALTSINEREQILNYFLSNVSGIDSDSYAITKYSSTTSNVKSFTINAIQSGHPVLLSVAMPNTAIGHAVVAYDCDPTTGEIYCHWGLGADQTHINPEDEGFTIFRNAMVIDFDMEHSHSNNYGVTTVINNTPSTQYYCYDDCRILTYTDLHSYTQNYESVSTTQHKAYCECGEYVFQNHVIQNNECIACGEPHTTHDYSDHFVHEDSTTHKSYCICGGYIISGHVVSNEEYISGKRYAICLACGGMASLGMIHHQGIGALPRTENGSFILPDGIIVLVDEDIEAYLVGTLEFIYPDGNLETE